MKFKVDLYDCKDIPGDIPPVLAKETLSLIASYAKVPNGLSLLRQAVNTGNYSESLSHALFFQNNSFSAIMACHAANGDLGWVMDMITEAEKNPNAFNKNVEEKDTLDFETLFNKLKEYIPVDLRGFENVFTDKSRQSEIFSYLSSILGDFERIYNEKRKK